MADYTSKDAFILDSEPPERIIAVVKADALEISPDMDSERLERVFGDVVALFNGEYPGFGRCTTKYHDLKHTLDVFVVMNSMLHGAYAGGQSFDREVVYMGLVAALMHDTGYIPSEADECSGASLTTVHVERSVEFARNYLGNDGVNSSTLDDVSSMIKCTSLEVSVKNLDFSSGEMRHVGSMLFGADILGQVSDRIYLEKLHYLYREFSDADVDGFKSEVDLLEKTLVFYETIMRRLDSELPERDTMLKNHFKVRLGIERNLYRESAERNIEYLRYLLDNHGSDYRGQLRRGGILG